MLPGLGYGVMLEDSEDFGVMIPQLRTAPLERMDEAVKVGNGTDKKRRRHAV
jgi:hypothetical protein